ncbi:hypothetical protein GGI06_000158 [Coemansia sp. S85]|nr:hypothetical protein GGI06_000158 [Coemansia sp. S85]
MDGCYMVDTYSSTVVLENVQFMDILWLEHGLSEVPCWNHHPFTSSDISKINEEYNGNNEVISCRFFTLNAKNIPKGIVKTAVEDFIEKYNAGGIDELHRGAEFVYDPDTNTFDDV